MILFCLSHAGGSAITFNKWRQYLDRHVRLIPLELPGHMSRAKEPLTSNYTYIMNDLQCKIIEVIGPSDMQYAIYGHSLGAVLAYECYVNLQNQGVRLPEHIFFAGSWPPYEINIPDNDMCLDNVDIFTKIVKERGLVNPSISDNSEIGSYFIELIRSDLQLMSNVPRLEPCNIQANITILWGSEDMRVPYESLLGWNQVAKANIRFVCVDGSHLFHLENPQDTVQIINQILLTNQ